MDAKSTFVKRFGDLVALLRVDPGNDAAQDLALAAAAAAVETEAVEVEAGIAWSVIPDELTLKGRLLARQVEAIRIAAGAEPHELLALARALSHDSVPIRPRPTSRSRWWSSSSPPPGVPPPRRSGAAEPPSAPVPPRDRASELGRAPPARARPPTSGSSAGGAPTGGSAASAASS